MVALLLYTLMVIVLEHCFLLSNAFCVLNTLPGNVLPEMLAVSDSFVDQNGPCCLCTPGYSVSAE